MEKLILAVGESLKYDDGAVQLCCSCEHGAATVTRLATEAERVVIPAQVEGVPVRALAAGLMQGNETVREVVCPSGVTHIGANAFARCANLESLELPAALAELDVSWTRHCGRLSRIALPGAAQEVPGWFLSNLELESVRVGAGTKSVEIPRAICGNLRQIEVDASNPWLSTEGSCLFGEKGRRLLACVVRRREYAVPQGCEDIAEQAFYCDGALVRVSLPDTVRRIGEGAFSRTGLLRFEAPPHLEELGARAFYECADLERVELNDGLRRIGDASFEYCPKLASLAVPASVEVMGRSDGANGDKSVSGMWPRLSIAAENPWLFVDAHGLLYKREDDGCTLVQATDTAVEDCAVMPGCVRIGASAFSRCSHLRSVTLPDGLAEIGPLAFNRCGALEKADLPDSVRFIGRRAFYGTGIPAFHVPAALEHLGNNAFVVDRSRPVGSAGPYSVNGGSISFGRTPAELMGAQPMGHGSLTDLVETCAVSESGEGEPHRVSITIGRGNERFFVRDGLFCQWEDERRTRARLLLYVGKGGAVVVPPEVKSIASFAFDQVKCVRSFRFGPKLETVETFGMTVGVSPETVDIDLADGRRAHLHVAPNEFGCRRFRSAFLGGRFDPQAVADGCDESLTYFLPGDDYWRMVDRLAHPVLMSDLARRDFEKRIERYLPDIVRGFARSERTSSIAQLCDLGFINDSNFDWALDTCRKANSVKAVGYLLEARRSSGQAAPDYGI